MGERRTCPVCNRVLERRNLIRYCSKRCRDIARQRDRKRTLAAHAAGQRGACPAGNPACLVGLHRTPEDEAEIARRIAEYTELAALGLPLVPTPWGAIVSLTDQLK